MNPLQVRAAAAIGLVSERLLDGPLALSYAVWPTRKLEAASKAQEGRVWTDEHRERCYELADAGHSQRRIALEVCGDERYRPTIAGWLKQRRGRLVA